jgi:hypothetical protein
MNNLGFGSLRTVGMDILEISRLSDHTYTRDTIVHTLANSTRTNAKGTTNVRLQIV